MIDGFAQENSLELTYQPRRPVSSNANFLRALKSLPTRAVDQRLNAQKNEHCGRLCERPARAATRRGSVTTIRPEGPPQ